MSNLDSRLWHMGHITPMEMWPRHTCEKHPMHHEVISDEVTHKHDEVFSYFYEILEKRPMTMHEWKTVFRSRNSDGINWRSLSMFENWVAKYHPGHVPYLSTWDELDGCARASWRQNSDERLCSDKAIFICLLGISYSP